MDLWSGAGKTVKRNIIETIIVSLVMGSVIAAGIIWSERADAVCVSPSGDSCTSWSRHQVRRFEHNRLGHSTGVGFTPVIKRKIRRWYANHPNARPVVSRDGTPWWQWPFEASMCMTGYGNSRTDCMTRTESAEDMRRVSRRTIYITMACGGSAIVGALHGGGWWGAGKGAGVCLWTAVAVHLYGP
jgi:hypothetical protein